jgi:putative membrane protein
MEENLQLAKKLSGWAWVISIIVIALVVMMREVKIPLPEGVSLGFLPPFHATVNAITAVVLIFAFWFIKQKNIIMHRRMIYIAMGLSVIFLLSYVSYHITMPETIFGDLNHDGVLGEDEKLAVGGSRTVYLIILGTHILLAGLILPFILFTFIRAYTNQIAKHRKMARWVFPLWLYVAITGPVCYLMLLPYYG